MNRFVLSKDSAKRPRTQAAMRGHADGASPTFHGWSAARGPMLRRACAFGGGCPRCGNESALHKHATSRGEARNAPGDVAPPIVHEVLRTQGRPIEPATRAPYEQRFSYDFSKVQVHTGDKAAASATAVDALAYTVGNHVVLGAGYRTSHAGEDGRLLAHELVHVMQWGDHAIPARLPIGPADGAAERQARAGAGAGVGQTHALQRAVPVCDEYQAGDAGSGRPSPGVTVSTSRSNKTATVTAWLETHGSESSPANASTIQRTIAQYWNGSFPDGYQITTNVSVTRRPPGQAAASNTLQVDVTRSIMPTRFNALFRDMTVNLDESDALTWAVAHEFGHALRLSDHYSEGILSKLGALFGVERSDPTVDPGYEQNIMGVTGGQLESRNVQDLIGINTPYTCVRWHLEIPL
jgi:Domain of unknown function (DUF4157)